MTTSIYKQRDIEAVYPLSPMQEGILFHSLESPESAIYWYQTTFMLKGDLDEGCFERAWQKVSDRHAPFRTAFLRDRPAQVVFRRAKLPILKEDWRGALAEEQKRQLDEYLARDRQRSFRPADVPQMRLALFRIGDHEYQFVWSHHHILLDAWSVVLVLKEVMTIYEAYRRGQEVHLPLPPPYQDYISWLQKRDLTEAKLFWMRTFGDVESSTPLPSLGPGEGEGYGHCGLHLSAQATSAIREFTAKSRVTLNTLSQSIWGLLLSRFSGEREVLFGTTVSGRPPELIGVQSMIGLFINTVPSRMRIEPDRHIADWLRDVQASQVEMRQYDYGSLVDVQSCTQVPRGTPLFQTLVVFENFSQNAFEETYGTGLLDSQNQKQNLKVTVKEASGRNNFPLNLIVAPKHELGLRLNYDRTLYSFAKIQQLLEHYRRLLEGAVEDPKRAVSELEILSAEEREQLLYGWNDTRSEYPAEQCVHELFEEQVERTPDAVAVVFEDSELSYRELNRRANRVAHCLIGLGVKPDTRVALCVERSLEMVVALLGVLKAGAAYVPLDPSYPAERFRFMLEDSAPAVLLTQRQSAELLSGISDSLPVLDLADTALWEHVQEINPDRAGLGLTSRHLAYVIYTSGSTGRAQGCGGQHGIFCNYVMRFLLRLAVGAASMRTVSTLACGLRAYSAVCLRSVGEVRFILFLMRDSRDGAMSMAEYAREHAAGEHKISSFAFGRICLRSDSLRI